MLAGRARSPKRERDTAIAAPEAASRAPRPRRRQRRAAARARLGDAPARRARAVRERFDYVLLDCPPSLGPLTVNALVAADRVIVPVQTEYFALEGPRRAARHARRSIQRELNPRLIVAGMLLTMHDGRTRLGARRRARGPRALPRRWSSTPSSRATCASARRRASAGPVIHHDPHCAGADAYFELAKEVGRAWLSPSAAWAAASPRSSPVSGRAAIDDDLRDDPGRADRARTRASRGGASTTTRSRRSPARCASAACCSRSSCGRSPAARYELVAGERRWRAAQLAGLEHVPAIVRAPRRRERRSRSRSSRTWPARTSTPSRRRAPAPRSSRSSA